MVEMNEDAGAEERASRKARVGTVLSDKMKKTVIVGVERRVTHPLYGKKITRTKKYYAHDEESVAHVGDTVRIVETRPLSKMKRWRVTEVLEQAK
jgi:small subunit ribosomal protein S17